ncbi:proton extrusion protein PcxA [Calothrix sp. FACHB-1219]|uniref:proton extrusion protein PcxA n=1 Tax=unclassified Calothrix TaxID=2619626 RepID=UPI001688A690|nr:MULTISPECIES: proton extrusion protein PcxA [unclassified Calothrix]MBD2202650.1 proton extrusion protein PcxA [Calothrix sp. FACHB-168]MBD2221720.1 proton extrusion protein PcxA [Calothrix sp. FACHB-1219]
MSSNSLKRQLESFGRIKDRFLGTPEQSLEQAYQAALKIEFIEGRYFNGEKIRNNSHIDFPQEDFEKNLDILQQRMKEFNGSRSTLSNLGQDHLMRLIFVEGILAKYNHDADNSSLANIPSSSSSAVVKQNSYSPAVNIIEVKDVKSVPANKRKKQTSESHAHAESDNGKSGVLPRSIKKTLDKVKNDLNPGAEEEIVNAYRRSRAITVIGLRLLALLIIVPLLTQQISKNFLILPMVEKFRVGEESQVFLNSEMKEEALKELNTYREELELESLIGTAPKIEAEAMEEKVKHKAVELTEEFRNKSNSAVSNVFADIVALVAFTLVLLFRRQDIAVLKSFIDNIVTGLSDSAKSFAIILTTDIFVGFHSPHGWEVLLEGLSAHLGIAANKSAISLFIATVPVVADTMIKYWIFRSLSRMSPSTVATLKEMDD